MNLTKIIDLIYENLHTQNTEKIWGLIEKLFDISEIKILDIYPYQILSNKKFSQVEIFFDALEKKDIEEKTSKYYTFKKTLEKFEKFFELLWLKNDDFYCFYVVDNIQLDVPNFEIKEWTKIKSKKTNSINLEKIEDYDFLITLVRLATFERMSIYFFMPSERIIMSSNGLNFVIYSDKNISWLEKIANVEGLYIR